MFYGYNIMLHGKSKEKSNLFNSTNKVSVSQFFEMKTILFQSNGIYLTRLQPFFGDRNGTANGERRNGNKSRLLNQNTSLKFKLNDFKRRIEAIHLPTSLLSQNITNQE